MINFDNHNITGMSYNNHTIKKAYGCDGHLVWEYVPPTPFEGKFKIKYNDGRVLSGECDTSSVLTSGETQPTGYGVTSMINAEIGSCVNEIGSKAFDDASNLVSVNLPEGLIKINSFAFRQTHLTSVVIPETTTNIASYAFHRCNYLTSVTVLATTPPALSGTGTAFDNTNECPIYVPASSVEAYKTTWSRYASRIQPIQ